MKNPRLTSVIFLFAALLQVASAQGVQGIEKILVKSFNLNGLQEVVIHAAGPVELKTWEGDFMRIQMTVHIDQANESMIKSLVQTGRYNLITEVEDGRWLVRTPGLNREVLRNGQALQERVSFLIFAPAHVKLEVQNSSSAGLPTNSSF